MRPSEIEKARQWLYDQVGIASFNDPWGGAIAKGTASMIEANGPLAHMVGEVEEPYRGYLEAERAIRFLLSEVERKDKALKPFAKAADGYDLDHMNSTEIQGLMAANEITIGDLRTAYAALNSAGNSDSSK